MDEQTPIEAEAPATPACEPTDAAPTQAPAGDAPPENKSTQQADGQS